MYSFLYEILSGWPEYGKQEVYKEIVSKLPGGFN
jgi:hypothetical protein